MEKYLTNQYYVGVINLSNPNNDDYELLRRNGAIRVSDINYNGRNYQRFLSTFIKISDVVFLSLHSVRTYTNFENSYDHCSNLISLKDILPKIDLNDELTIFEVLYLFNALYRKHFILQNKVLYNNKYLVKDICLGQLVYFSENNNLPIEALLMRNSYIFDYFKKDNLLYIKFPCIFYKDNDSYINLCDNQIYSEDNNNINYCEISNQSTQIFKDRMKKKDNDTISVQKCLKFIK